MACCDICGAVYTFQKNLLRHIVMTHNEHEQPPLVKCEQCDYEGSYTNLLQHKKNMHREKAIICSLCGENFYTKDCMPSGICYIGPDFSVSEMVTKD